MALLENEGWALNYEVVGKLILNPKPCIFKLRMCRPAGSYCRAKIVFWKHFSTPVSRPHFGHSRLNRLVSTWETIL